MLCLCRTYEQGPKTQWYMYVYVYVYVYEYVSVSMYVCMYIYIYMYILYGDFAIWGTPQFIYLSSCQKDFP